MPSNIHSNNEGLVKDYFSQLSELLDRIAPACPSGVTIAIKHFFGGAAAYADKRIFMSLTNVRLALKLPHEDRLHLFRSGDARELRFFTNAQVKKQYALISKDIVNDHAATKSLIEKSIAFALSGNK